MNTFNQANAYNLYIKKIFSILFFLTSIDLFCANELKLIFAKHNTGELSIAFLKQIKEVFNINTFIETGTCIGTTAGNAAQVFDQVETVELCEDFYGRAKQNLSDYKNVRLYLGDSAKMLNTMIQASIGNIAFWLDGHYSANGSALGDVNTPILSELKCIKESGLKNAVIMIDDIRLFDKHINKIKDLDIGGYPTIQEVYSLLLDINPSYDVVIIGDVLLAFEKSEAIKISDVLRACSVTRIDLNLSDKEWEDAAKIIGNARDEEFVTVTTLYKIYCKQEHFVKYGIGAHYALWVAFQLIEKQKFSSALHILNGPVNLGMDASCLEKMINKVATLSQA